MVNYYNIYNIYKNILNYICQIIYNIKIEINLYILIYTIYNNYQY